MLLFSLIVPLTFIASISATPLPTATSPIARDAAGPSASASLSKIPDAAGVIGRPLTVDVNSVAVSQPKVFTPGRLAILEWKAPKSAFEDVYRTIREFKVCFHLLNQKMLALVRQITATAKGQNEYLILQKTIVITCYEIEKLWGISKAVRYARLEQFLQYWTENKAAVLRFPAGEVYLLRAMAEMRTETVIVTKRLEQFASECHTFEHQLQLREQRVAEAVAVTPINSTVAASFSADVQVLAKAVEEEHANSRRLSTEVAQLVRSRDTLVNARCDSVSLDEEDACVLKGNQDFVAHAAMKSHIIDSNIADWLKSPDAYPDPE